jgi:Stage II sporulation protein E (SpoIIE)
MLTVAAISPGLAEAARHSAVAAKTSAAPAPAAAVTPLATPPQPGPPATPAPAPQPAPDQGQPGPDQPAGGSGSGSGSGAGSGQGTGTGAPGPDQGATDDDGNGNGNGNGAGAGNGDGNGDGDGTSGSGSGSNGSGDGTDQGTPQPGPGDPVTTTPDEGATSTPGDSGNRPAVSPVLPITVPAVTPVIAPQRQSTGNSQRRRARSGNGGSNGGSNAGSGASSGSRSANAGGVAGASGSGALATGPATGGSGAAGSGTASGTDQPSNAKKKQSGSDKGSPVTRTVTRTVRDIVRVVPNSAKVALAALAALAVLLGAGYLFTATRARRLTRQRRELLQEVGLLQGALLPSVPTSIGSVRTSVAYRPADGPGAGGDFYDVLALTGGRVGFILGDVSGHGHAALERTAFMRYTLRAYLEAGLEPRVALQVAGRVIDDNLGGDFATVLLAVHDPSSGSLTYASAGHPSPIVAGRESHVPVTSASSPPIGVGVRTGLRQTTIPLGTGSVAVLFTDGLIEARTPDGVLGRERLQKIVDDLGPGADAEQLLASVAAHARVSSDDMATCLIAPSGGATAGGFQTEQLELTSRELHTTLAEHFLAACEVPQAEIDRALEEAATVAAQFGAVVLHVVLGNRRTVDVLPRNVESIEAASRRAALAG